MGGNTWEAVDLVMLLESGSGFNLEDIRSSTGELCVNTDSEICRFYICIIKKYSENTL